MQGNLNIQTILAHNKTILSKGYFTPPFKLANITEDKLGKVLQLMLMTSSPGVLDGDAYDIKIRLAQGSLVQLQTQSYQRIFTMKQMATQNMEVHLEANASFFYLPHPVVPHEGADFVARNKIFLSNGCSLFWGEVLTCGRKLNGEVFKFTRLQNITEIYLNKRLIIKENLCIRPSEIEVNAIGQLEGFTHQASLICLHQSLDFAALQQSVTNYLSNEKELVFGVTEAPIKGVVVRLLAQRGEQLHGCLKHIAQQVQNHIKPLTTADGA